MSGNGKDPDGESFRGLLGDVDPLSGRDKLRPEPTPRSRARVAEEDQREVDFSIDRIGDRIEGTAGGVDRALLRDLASGRRDTDVTLDLHGDDLPNAKQRVRAAFEQATRDGARCLSIVHGRGRHSEDGPVLKEAVVAWITAPPLAARVLAFASAPSDRGGAGATRVLLRRLR